VAQRQVLLALLLVVLAAQAWEQHFRQSARSLAKS
jgi:hypothetical protein